MGGAGSYSYENLKKKALGEAKQLAQDIQNGEYKNSAYNVKQLANTLNTIIAAEEEMEKMYFGESELAEQSGVKYPVRSLDGVEKAFNNPNSIAAKNWASSTAKKAKPTSFSTPKKPSLDTIWQKVEHAVSMQFPDGEPIDILGPWLDRNNLTIDDVNRAAKKHGYKSLYHYWDALASDYESDARSDWEHSGRKGPEPKVHRFTMNEMPDTSGPVGTQPGGWRRTDTKEVADTQTDLNKTGGFITPEHDNAYSQLKRVAPKLYNFIRNEAPVPLDPVLTLKMFGQIRNENQVLQMMKQHLQQDTRKMYGDKHPSLAESLKRFWNNMISESKKIKGADGKACWKGYRYAGTEKGKDKCVPVKKESSIMKGLTK